jgi:hypothetical protein
VIFVKGTDTRKSERFSLFLNGELANEKRMEKFLSFVYLGYVQRNYGLTGNLPINNNFAIDVLNFRMYG